MVWARGPGHTYKTEHALKPSGYFLAYRIDLNFRTLPFVTATVVKYSKQTNRVSKANLEVSVNRTSMDSIWNDGIDTETHEATDDGTEIEREWQVRKQVFWQVSVPRFRSSVRPGASMPNQIHIHAISVKLYCPLIVMPEVERMCSPGIVTDWRLEKRKQCK